MRSAAELSVPSCTRSRSRLERSSATAAAEEQHLEKLLGKFRVCLMSLLLCKQIRLNQATLEHGHVCYVNPPHFSSPLDHLLVGCTYRKLQA